MQPECGRENPNARGLMPTCVSTSPWIHSNRLMQWESRRLPELVQEEVELDEVQQHVPDFLGDRVTQQHDIVGFDQDAF